MYNNPCVPLKLDELTNFAGELAPHRICTTIRMFLLNLIMFVYLDFTHYCFPLLTPMLVHADDLYYEERLVRFSAYEDYRALGAPPNATHFLELFH